MSHKMKRKNGEVVFMEKWTMKDILKGKLFTVILLTIALTFSLTKLINTLLTREVVHDNGFIYTTHFYLPVPAILGLVIPAGLLSVLLIQFFMNKFSKHKAPTTSDVKFRWNTLYGLAIGAVAYFGLTKTVTMNLLFAEFDGGIMKLIWTFFGVLLPFVVGIGLTLLINYWMIKKTGTNRAILLEFEQHKYSHRFKKEETKKKVFQALRRGRATTILGAIVYVKVVALLFKVIKAIGLIYALTIAKALSSEPRRSGGYATFTQGSNSTDAVEHEKEKQLARYKARQDQKQANYSARQFEKQFNYNSRYAGPELNRYIHDQRKANESRKKANRM